MRAVHAAWNAVVDQARRGSALGDQGAGRGYITLWMEKIPKYGEFVLESRPYQIDQRRSSHGKSPSYLTRYGGGSLTEDSIPVGFHPLGGETSGQGRWVYYFHHIKCAEFVRTRIVPGAIRAKFHMKIGPDAITSRPGGGDLEASILAAMNTPSFCGNF